MDARTALLSLAGAVTCLGCYSYVPTTLELVPPGSEVRALVSTEGQAAILYGVGLDARSIVGTLESKDSDTLHFAVRAPFAVLRPGAPTDLVRFALAPRDVLHLELKRLNRLKTGSFAGALLVTTGAFVVMAARGKNQAGSQPGQTGLPPGR
jgi:hypothetical protein